MENRACDRRHDTSHEQTSPGDDHLPRIHVSILVFSTPTEKCFLSDNIYDYFNVSQGKITVPGIDDGEESQLADVSLQTRLLPAAPCRVTHTHSFTPKKLLRIGKSWSFRRLSPKRNSQNFLPPLCHLLSWTLSLLNLKSLFRELPLRSPRMKIIFQFWSQSEARTNPLVSL